MGLGGVSHAAGELELADRICRHVLLGLPVVRPRIAVAVLPGPLNQELAPSAFIFTHLQEPHEVPKPLPPEGKQAGTMGVSGNFC